MLLMIDQCRYDLDRLMQNMLVLLCCLFALSCCSYQAAPYAEWAHSHLVWLNRGQQNQSSIEDLLLKYQSYSIPVGAVNIDSDWSTCLNNFQFDKRKFPNPQLLLNNLHAQQVKVILWATSIVNIDCPIIYEEGVKNGYFLNHGKHVHWWEGNGAFLDYFNPKAKEWWFKQMDKVINMGFDGWKLDGADPIIMFLRPWPYSTQLKRYISYRQYANQYYGSFYNYTKSKNPDALVMSRPVDSLKNKVFLSYSPKYVMFAGWVGDQDSSAAGFQEAMVNILHSASKGYLNFGFDIGGYRGQNISKNIYLRWMQTGALLPFMENGGNGKHQPWKFDAETIDIYRKFTLLHYALKQFFLTAGTEAYKKKVSVIQPLVKDTKTIELTHSNNFGYVLWNTFLHFPIFQENGFTNLTFPKGNKWIYYFNHSKVFEGGSNLAKAFKIDESPFFMKPNTIIPISSQIWAVYLCQGYHTKTIIGGSYSDEVAIQYKESNLSVQIMRYYKNDEVKLININRNTIKVRFIGVSVQKLQEHHIQYMIADLGKEIEIEVEIGVNAVIQNVTYHHPILSDF